MVIKLKTLYRALVLALWGSRRFAGQDYLKVQGKSYPENKSIENQIFLEPTIWRQLETI